MALTERHKRYLNLMGIQAWELRNAPPPALGAEVEAGEPDPIISAAPVEVVPEEALSRPHESGSDFTVATMDWKRLRDTVLRCEQCELHKTRTQAVFGVGNQQAQWMVVGEASGADEDKQGEPFVGRAGQLLNNMLFAMGLKREEVYIANVLKCRPPNNRDPRPEEVLRCEDYLKRQVALIRPKIILAVGRIAAHNLLKTDNSLAKLRNKTFYYSDSETPLIVTYHPAYLLRSPGEKRKAWQDLQYAMNVSKQQ